MPTTPQPCATITLDVLATIAARIQPLNANAGDTRTTRRIEAIFASYGIAFTDTPAAPDRETPCH
jgi:hypothetical protein